MKKVIKTWLWTWPTRLVDILLKPTVYCFGFVCCLFDLDNRDKQFRGRTHSLLNQLESVSDCCVSMAPS